ERLSPASGARFWLATVANSPGSTFPRGSYDTPTSSRRSELTMLLMPAAIAALATFVAAWTLARLAPRVGWVDGGDRGHKLGAQPLPLCGGAAITCGLLAGWACMNALGRERASFVPGRELAALLGPLVWPGATLLPWGGVLVAFAVGLIDDLSPDGL